MLAAGSVVVFTSLTLAVFSGLSDRLDSAILLWFRAADGSGRGPEWFGEAVTDITALGSYPILILALTFTLCALMIRGRHAMSLFLVLSIVTGMAASAALKLILFRERPDLVEQLVRTFTASFPSGHAMLSMLTWLTLAAMAARFMPDVRLRYLTIISAVVLSLMIGLSRVYLGVHWPTDVLAGWVAGLGWVSGWWLVAHYLSHRDHDGSNRDETSGGHRVVDVDRSRFGESDHADGVRD